MAYKKLLPILILFLLGQPWGALRAAIDFRSTQLNTSDGLPNNSVRYIYQDSKGFLWMATLNGLSRYDGNSFVTYRPEQGEDVSLVDNRIFAINEDKDGFLWINTTPEMFSCYDLRRSRFVDFTGCGELRQNYSALFVASNGDVWLSHSRNGCRQVRHGRDGQMTSTVYRVERGNLPDNQVEFVGEDNAGRIWIGTRSGLVSVAGGKYRIEERSKRFLFGQAYQGDMYFLTADGIVYRYRTTTGKLRQMGALPAQAVVTAPTGCFLRRGHWTILTTTGVYNYRFDSERVEPDPRLDIERGEVIRDNRGDYWIYNHTGHLTFVAANSDESKEFALISPDKIGYIDYERYHVVRDSRGIAWISTYGNGLFAYDPTEDRLEHFLSSADNMSHISSDFLLYVMEDRSGGIWVSSEYSGVSRISVEGGGTMRIYPESPELFDRSNTIRMLTRMPGGDIWVGTRKGGLYAFDANLRQKVSSQYFASNIYAITDDAQGRTWMGTRGGGLRIGDQWYRNNPTDPTTISNDNVFAIHRDRKDRMWVGTFGGGLDLAELGDDGKYRFRHFFQQTYGLRMTRVIEEDKDGMVWLGTSEGICVFHPDSLALDAENYRLFSYTNRKFCSNEIKCLYADGQGRMWVGTSGSGLNLCELADGGRELRYEHYGSAEGLANDVVQSILGDEHGNLWVATEYGISKFNVDNRSFENFFFSSYTLGNVYSENSACVSADGKLVFGTNYGMVSIDPDEMRASESFQPVVCTSIYVNGTLMTPQMEDSPLRQSPAYSDEIRLKHYQNSLLIDFSTFDYSENGRTKYKYWLENYDKEWSAPSSLNFASFKYLAPGEYVLHVKSCNSAGVWNEKETRLRLVIVPPIWRTGWAISLYALLLAALLYLSFRVFRNFNSLRNRVDVEKRLTEYKLVFFTNISHEFRTPLTLIQGTLEKIHREGGIPARWEYPLRIMDKNTQRLLRLINQLLEFRKMQNNKLSLSLEEMDVVAFLHDIFLSFGDVAEQKRMNYDFVPSIPSYRMFADKGNLDKVAYNLLSNAFKYTPQGGTITFAVEVDEAAGLLRFRVTDTGVGIPREKQGELFKRFMQNSFSGDSIGVGLHLTHELVLVHKGTIEFQEREGGGSVFTVCLPTDKEVYEEQDFLVSSHLWLKDDEELMPVVQEPAPTPPAAEANSDTPTPVDNDRPKILVIEDDADIRAFLREELSAFFEVETAADGTSGLARAKEYDADLIVCDVLMPGLTGFEVTRALKTDFDTSHIPIILLTALNSPEKQQEGIESGADAYLAKPFSLKLLLTYIYRLMEQRERLREKYSREPGLNRPLAGLSAPDREFVARLGLVVEQNLARQDFSIEEFARFMKLGRTVFYRKLSGITGYTPNEYLRVMRIKKAAELLLSEYELTVAEVAFKVGIKDPFYFSKCFKAQFGVSPSAYQKGMRAGEEPE
ncbi:MAG: response regulator [Mediterranea sp.]|jgi:signal transduction histidine kinase/ligand-binding sensor domain-containing protein/DNA-binding response OmpR family regulator|nr:response regulator [Mediterranea sp.]